MFITVNIQVMVKVTVLTPGPHPRADQDDPEPSALPGHLYPLFVQLSEIYPPAKLRL